MDSSTPATLTSKDTTQTLDILKAILDPKINCDGKTTGKATKGVTRRGVTRAVGSKSSRPGSRAVGHNNLNGVPETLVQKQQFATDAFNSALKTLSSAVKTQQSQSQAENISNLSQTPFVCRPPSALKPISPNKKKSEAAATTDKNDLIHFQTVAECANTAFDCLSNLSEQESGSDPQQEARLHKGGLVLLDKLVSLELIGPATCLAEKLRARFLKRWNTLETSGTAGEKATIIKGLSSFVRIPMSKEYDHGALDFVNSYQCQTLRLAILIGPKAVDEDFLEAIRLEHPGSPANNVLTCLQRGEIDSEVAGLRLRTISLALSKLQHMCTELRKPSLASLSLMFEAYQIKVKSWQYLGHKPDLPKELWQPLLRGMKKFQVTKRNKIDDVWGIIDSYVQSIQNCLRMAQLPTELPEELLKLLHDGRKGKGTETVESLAKQLQSISLDSSSGAAVAASRCKSVITILAKFPSDIESITDTVRSALEAMMSQLDGKMADFDDLLAHGTKMRKSMVDIIETIEQQQTKMPPKQELLLLLVLSVRLVYFFLSFLAHYVDLLSSKNLNLETKKVSGIITTVAKSIEAIFKFQKSEVCATGELQHESVIVLKRCNVLAQKVVAEFNCSNDSIRGYLTSLPVRTSQIYWARYLSAIENRQPGKVLIGLLECSIASIETSTQPHSPNAFLSLKYEKLAEHYADDGDHPKSQQALRQAIQLSVQQGVLTEAVQRSCNVSLQASWAIKETRVYILGKLLARYIAKQLQPDPSVVGGNWFYDDDSLKPVERCVLLEKQLLTCLELPDQQVHQLLIGNLFSYVLGVFEKAQIPARTLRYLSQCLKYGGSTKTIPLASLLPTERMFSFVDAECLAVPIDLNPSSTQALRLLVQSQWSFLNGKPSLSHHLQVAKSLWLQLQKCQNLQDLKNILDDPDLWTAQLQTIATHASILDQPQLQYDLLRCRGRILELQKAPLQLIVDNLIPQGMMLQRLSQSSEAGKVFLRVEKLLSTLNGPNVSFVEWALGYADHSREVSNYPKSQALIERAKSAFDAIWLSAHDTPKDARLDREIMICRAALLASRLAFQQGLLGASSLFARQAVKLSSAMWSFFNKPASSADYIATQTHVDDSTQVSQSESSTLSLTPLTVKDSEGIQYWTCLTLHRAVLTNMACVAAHLGLHPDALYYHQQVLRISESTMSDASRYRQKSALMLHCARAGEVRKAKATSDELLLGTTVVGDPRLRCSSLLDQAEAWLVLQDTETAASLFCQGVEVHSRFQQATTSSGKGQQNVGRPELQLPDTLAQPRRRRPGDKQNTKATINVQPGTRSVAVPTITDDDSDSNVCWEMRLLAERINIIGRRFELLDKDVPSLATTPPLKCHTPLPNPSAQENTLKATLIFREGIDHLSSEAVHNVLIETAIGIPVRYKSNVKNGRVSFIREQSPAKVINDTRRPTAKKDGNKKQIENTSTFSAMPLFNQAQQLLTSVGERQIDMSMLDTVHSFHKTYARLALFSAASQQPFVSSSLTLASQAMLSKDIALHRERLAIEADMATSTRQEIRTWPDTETLCVKTMKLHSLSDSITMLPSSWSVVSMELNEDLTEMIVTRIVKDRSPFIMRLPLSRANLEDGDEHDFDFQNAKSEILDIIKQAGETAHDKRGQGDGAARKAWYADRETLDRRLEMWLGNIENLWLGGFRGLLNSHQVSDQPLFQFGQALSQILELHLPSRQKSNKSQTLVELHAHVLELFVSVGQPDHDEVEDAVTDLLYFVVDILQFNGERNAYDEIDFDAMLVSTLDALKQHHERAAGESRNLDGHLILVLDKEMQCFPWESIPCLQGKPVSRMPSLGSIFERVQKLRAHASNPDLFAISTSNGAYMLNPSSDLASTENTFSSTLTSQLASFESITNRAPTEAEFERFVHESDLFLYFGHGSGAQYIRGRSIRKMDRAAVTWLMGCSSAKMTECGAFENYGMPLNYMHAGSPAVVGTLWDVTDRDIDRFAMTALVEWGLFEEDEVVKEVLSKKKKGKSKAKESRTNGKTSKYSSLNDDQSQIGKATDRRGKVSICRAVLKGREACLLRYINGAAPVIYGVPVVLE